LCRKATHQKIFPAKKTKTPAEQFGGSGRGRPAEKSFLAFGAKIGSSVGVKTHHFRVKIQIFALSGDFLLDIFQFLPQAKTTFRPLSESGFWD
jgi:hypothetical protein